MKIETKKESAGTAIPDADTRYQINYTPIKSSMSIPVETLLELADIQKRFAELYRKYSGVAAIADYGVQLMSDSLIETFGEYEVADKSGSFEMLTANFSGTMFFAVRELPS